MNRGLISPKALARVDLDRTRLSAEVMTNWLPKSQGHMTIRPGTKYLGSSFNDSGAEFMEFVATTTDVALLEQTKNKMRVWIDDALMGRPAVSATLSFSDTGWADISTGGIVGAAAPTDLIPQMTGSTTNGVTINVSSENAGDSGWKVADNSTSTMWRTTSDVFDSGWAIVDFGAGNTQRIRRITLRSGGTVSERKGAPKDWYLQGNDVDTGTGWTTEITSVGVDTGWGDTEQRSYYDTGYTDTGANAWRYWRLLVPFVQDSGNRLTISEMEFFADTGVNPSQVNFSSSTLTLNAGARGSIAKTQKRVFVNAADTGVEHSLDINVANGPVTLRVGSNANDDDYVTESDLATGYHNLAFTPGSEFWVTIHSHELVNRVINSIAVGDSGTVELTTPWTVAQIDNLRYSQSADVIFANSTNVRPQRIERRGTGRSWSVVDYNNQFGPFLPGQSNSIGLRVAQKYGNTTMYASEPFFREEHVGSLWRISHNGQDGEWLLGAKNAVSDSFRVQGIRNSAGDNDTGDERYIKWTASGTYKGTITLERSFEDYEYGFHRSQSNNAVDTGTFSHDFRDQDDNVTAYYRLRMSEWDSGAATVTLFNPGGQVTGMAKVTSYVSPTEVGIEVIRNFGDTGFSEEWNEGAWSNVQGYPSAVALHEGRVAHAGAARVWMSVSDDYENFDDETVGDSAPIDKTLGQGPVDNIFYLLSLVRLILGTSGSELGMRASSLDEVLTPSNVSVKPFSTQGSANLRALQLDSTAVFVQRSKTRLYKIGFGQGVDAVGDYDSNELTVLVPELLEAGVVSIAIQRQPDTRIHLALADGKVAILTYEPEEEILAWSMFETDGSVERVMVLPGQVEDQVYYHVNRTINGVTKRFLEKWAKESECQGDTGLSWLADCAVSYTDTGRATLVTGFDHLVGESVVGWSDDTGQTDAGKDLTPDDTGGAQVLLTVDTGGDITIDTGVSINGVHHFVGGLPYTARYKSTKMAYGAEMGTALTMVGRSTQMGLVAYQTHNNGLYFGGDTGDTGDEIDPLPRRLTDGGRIDADHIYKTLDTVPMQFQGKWDEDPRVVLHGKAPRPVTVMGIVPNVEKKESD
jgi:hypothetical protein